MQPSSPKTAPGLVGFLIGFTVAGLLLIAGSRLIMSLWG